MRQRHIFTWAGSAAVLLALLATDPDHGIGTGMVLLGLATPIIAIAFAHLARKALFDYKAADMERLFTEAAKSPVGAGLALIALAMVLNGMLGLFGKSAHAAVDVRTFVPAQAKTFAPMLRYEQRKYWPDHPRAVVLAGLAEQESCPNLTSSRCWSPTSSLKTAREEGAGLGQITRAYRSDGTLRFDSLADMRRQYPDLSDWSWQNVYSRPDLQLRAIVLMSRANYQALRTVTDPGIRLAFADAAYNGGLAGVQSERRACQIKAGCDPQKWFGHVEQTCLKSRTPLYGQRSACDINREHVTMVLTVRSDKYAMVMT
jgi:hypothetical protein